MTNVSKKKGILAEFLRKNRAEVLRVSIFEYDEEKTYEDGTRRKSGKMELRLE